MGEKDLAASLPGETWRGERPGRELGEGDRTAGQEGRREVSVLDAPVLTESQDLQSRRGTAPASTLHPAQDRKGGFQSQQEARDRREAETASQSQSLAFRPSDTAIGAIPVACH